MSTRNLMEEIVRNCLRDIVRREHGLSRLTEDQLSDVMAIALNRLTPKYVTTPNGETFAKTQLRTQVESDAYRELAVAIDKVTHDNRRADFSRNA